MALPSASALRRRWTESEAAKHLVAEAVEFAASGHTRSRQTLDLRGASIGLDGPLADFRLFKQQYEPFDMSHGKGVLIIVESEIRGLCANRFKFDRASRWSRSKIRDSAFIGAHFRLDATDVEFSNCDLEGSSFAGGFNEYGFRRCRFHNCNFARMQWRNTYFRACQFRDCSFEEASLAGSLLAGMRFYGSIPSHDFFECNETGSVFFDDIPQNVNAP